MEVQWNDIFSCDRTKFCDNFFFGSTQNVLTNRGICTNPLLNRDREFKIPRKMRCMYIIINLKEAR